MSKISWLHISDLHIPRPSKTADAEKYNQSHVLDASVNFLSTQFPKEIERPQFVLVTGDLAFKGTAEDYQSDGYCVMKFIKALAVSLQIAESDFAKRLLLVPGNHDVNRKYLSDKQGEAANLKRARDRDTVNQTLLGQDSTSKGIREQILRRFDDYVAFLRVLWGQKDLTVQDALWYTKQFTDEAGLAKVDILGLCSAWLCHSRWLVEMDGTDQQEREEDTAHLTLGEALVTPLVKRAGQADLTIALMHHDCMITADANSNLPQLLHSRCNFILCGHQHSEAWAEPLDGNAHKLRAGCLYEHHGRRNAFNLVEVDVPDNKVRMMTVHYRPDKEQWFPDREDDPTHGTGRHGYVFDGSTGILTFPLREERSGKGAFTEGDRGGIWDGRYR